MDPVSLTGNKSKVMKGKIILISCLLISFASFSQEEGKQKPADTTRMNVGNTEILIIDHGESDEIEITDGDTIYVTKEPKKEAHWAGIDFGVTMLMNESFGNNFTDYPYWNNEAAKSHVWNLNILEHKFNIAREYFGVTTGLGFSFTSVAFKNNYVLNHTADTLNAFIDTVNAYSKNKLKAAYLTVPLLLEFNSNINAKKSFYLAAGVVGGVRLTSKVKRKGEFDGKEFTEKHKGTYALNSFKLDAALRLGYSDFGVFANYSLLPLFDIGKTTAVYPLTFGLSYNF